MSDFWTGFNVAWELATDPWVIGMVVGFWTVRVVCRFGWRRCRGAYAWLKRQGRGRR